jgi:hypothetical protein
MEEGTVVVSAKEVETKLESLEKTLSDDMLTR